MSIQDPTPAPSYGIKTFDLSTARDTGDELIRARNTRSIAIIQVDDEAYARFGGVDAPRVDLRDFTGQTFNRPEFIDESLGEIYIENPAGSGDLQLFLGGDITTTPEDASNQTGIVGDTITPGASNVSFGDQPVPDGYAVVVQNDPTNNDNVAIVDDGGSTRHVLEPGSSFTVSVSNLNQITVNGTANNPTVYATVEAP